MSILIGFSLMTLFSIPCESFRWPQVVAEPTLELAHVMYRHGDRAPIRPYPTDPYINGSVWPEGWGQLTKKGKAMEYLLGSWLRERYIGFVTPFWTPGEVNITSTNVDRTLMSAQCIAAAFYYPSEEQRFDLSLAWVPTPIHTSPAIYDMLLNVEESCPRIKLEDEIQNELPEVQNFLKEHQKLFKHLSKYSGANITTVSDFDDLYDTLRIQNWYGLNVPKWAAPYMDEMKNIYDYTFEMLALTQEMKRLRAGPVINDINAHMKKKAERNLTEKLIMYSAHDTTVALLMNGLGIFNGIAPPYATAIMIELHNISEAHYVKAW